MHLLNVKTLSLEEFTGSKIPPYAILSHTWQEGQEVTLQELGRSGIEKKTGYRKIRLTCQQAEKDGLTYAWIDTCCIDKKSSAELSEAINSMFKWYKDAKICYAYLEDINSDGSNLKAARWFTRGWTLQECVAPRDVIFYSKEWKCIGSKLNLASVLSSITGIDKEVLLNVNRMPDICIARRMFWASKRETARIEDQAYCLLGIFNVAMPLLYGEGEKAFIRLQEEIIKCTKDQSILAWAPKSANICGCFATSPAEFSRAADIEPVSVPVDPWSIVPEGLSIRLPLVSEPWESCEYLAILERCNRIEITTHHEFYTTPMTGNLGVPLRAMNQDHTLFVRSPRSIGPVRISEERIVLARVRSIYIAKDALNLHLPPRYLDIRLRNPWPSAEIHDLDSFGFVVNEGAMSNFAKFSLDKERRGIKINLTASQDGLWQHALLWRYRPYKSYAIIVELAGSDRYSASVDIQALPYIYSRFCDDYVLHMMDSERRHSDTRITDHVETSTGMIFSTTLHASIRWEQERLVLTVEHITALLPFVSAYILPYDFKLGPVHCVVALALPVALYLSLMSEERAWIAWLGLQLGYFLLYIETSPAFRSWEHLFTKHIREHRRYRYFSYLGKSKNVLVFGSLMVIGGVSVGLIFTMLLQYLSMV